MHWLDAQAEEAWAHAVEAEVEVETELPHEEVHKGEVDQPVPEETSNGEAVHQDEKDHLAPEVIVSETDGGELAVAADQKASRPVSMIGSETAGSIPDED